MSRFGFLYAQSKFTITLTGLALIVLLGVLDYVTGPQISFSVFYLLPISLVTWLADHKSGRISATFSAFTWLAADLSSQTVYSHPLIPYWNAIVRLLVFLTIVYLETALKNLNHFLEDRIKDRTASLEAEVIERRKVEDRLQQYTKRLGILREIDQAILTAQSLETIARATILNIKRLLSCDRVSIVLFKFDTQQVIIFDTNKDDTKANFLKTRIPIDRLGDINLVLESIQRDDVQLMNDLRSTPLKLPVEQIMQSQDYRSLIIAPIRVHDDLIGSINLMARRPNAFSPEHLEIGREVANQLGIAIQQATLIDQLRTNQENLQILSQRLLEVQEDERRSIARELHDEVGQALTGIALTLEMTSQSQIAPMDTGLEQAHSLVVELMERVSQLTLELRPALLDDLGLLPTLLWYFDRYSSQTNIRVHFKHSELEDRRFDQEVETATYRIIQEALTNVARHAQVSKVEVTLWFSQGILGLQVEDQGTGFDPELEQSKGGSSGLLGMRERALLLNGKLTIESAEASGTRLLAEIPISEQFD